MGTGQHYRLRHNQRCYRLAAGLGRGRADVEQGEADHASPEWLPGGRAVLFTITAVNGGLDAARVAVLDLQSGTRKVLMAGTHAHYVPSEAGASGHEGGHLVYATAGT